MTNISAAPEEAQKTDESAFAGFHEHQIFAELDGARKEMLDIHKNPVLVSILNSCETLKALDEKKELPLEYIKKAKGLMFFAADKVGFGISITQGYGLVIARAPHRPSGWSPPLPIKVDGFSVGAVMGFSETLTMVAFANDTDLNNFKNEKRAMKLGVDVAVSMTGNTGALTKHLNIMDKGVQYDTDAIESRQEELSTKAFTVNKRGLIVDIALKGMSVECDHEDIESSYGPKVTPSQILDGSVPPPREATILYNLLLNYQDRHSAPVTGQPEPQH